MKKIINLNYKLFPSQIHEMNDGCYFYVSEVKYYFLKYTGDVNYLDTLVRVSNNLYLKDIKVHTFVATIDNKFFCEVDGFVYVLLKVNAIEKEEVVLEDIVKFNGYVSSHDYNINIVPWNKIWENKVDLVENEISELNKEHPILQSVYNYYIGLSENAISYVKDTFNEESDFVINLQHRRIRDGINYGYLYNPLTFTFDYEVRDLAEYIKFNFFNGSLDLNLVEKVILSKKFGKGSCRLLFGRLLYPSYFFDLCVEIFTDKVSDECLKKYIVKASEYEDVLVDIYFMIKRLYDIPPVYWILNK